MPNKKEVRYVLLFNDPNCKRLKIMRILYTGQWEISVAEPVKDFDVGLYTDSHCVWELPQKLEDGITALY